MTQTHDEMIAVIQAHKDGKRVQWRNRGSEQNEWRDATPPTFSFGELEYRVKPESPEPPREFWLCPEDWNGGVLGVYTCRQIRLRSNEPVAGQIHVREVIE